MKTTGIILVALGGISTLGAIVGAANGKQTTFSGIIFIALGAFLISRTNKKKNDDEDKRRWEEDNND